MKIWTHQMLPLRTIGVLSCYPLNHPPTTEQANSVRKFRTVHGKADRLIAGREYGQEQYRAAGVKIKNFDESATLFLSPGELTNRVSKRASTSALLLLCPLRQARRLRRNRSATGDVRPDSHRTRPRLCKGTLTMCGQ